MAGLSSTPIGQPRLGSAWPGLAYRFRCGWRVEVWREEGKLGRGEEEIVAGAQLRGQNS